MAFHLTLWLANHMLSIPMKPGRGQNTRAARELLATHQNPSISQIYKTPPEADALGRLCRTLIVVRGGVRWEINSLWWRVRLVGAGGCVCQR